MNDYSQQYLKNKLELIKIKTIQVKMEKIITFAKVIEIIFVYA